MACPGARWAGVAGRISQDQLPGGSLGTQAPGSLSPGKLLPAKWRQGGGPGIRRPTMACIVCRWVAITLFLNALVTQREAWGRVSEPEWSGGGLRKGWEHLGLKSALRSLSSEDQASASRPIALHPHSDTLPGPHGAAQPSASIVQRLSFRDAVGRQ